jgi:hypothetical protein
MLLVDINADPNAALVDGVTEAWTMDPRAAQADPAKLEELPVSDARVRPYLVAIPGRIADLERRVAAHRGRGGPAVIRICPGPYAHGYPLVTWAVSPIPEYCAREELALVIDFHSGATGYPWSEIVDFARAYPRLAVVALAAPLNGPTAGRALDATANLILDTSAASATEAVAVGELAATRGAYRLAYGTGATRMPGAVVLKNVDAADAEEILAGTARHLAAGTWSSTYL